jgi:hypothetical protein
MVIKTITQPIEAVVSKLLGHYSSFIGLRYEKRSIPIENVISGIKIDEKSIDKIVSKLSGHENFAGMEIIYGGLLVGEVTNNILTVTDAYVPENSLGILMDFHMKNARKDIESRAKNRKIWGYVEYWPHNPTGYNADNKDSNRMFETVENLTIREKLSKKCQKPPIRDGWHDFSSFTFRWFLMLGIPPIRSGFRALLIPPIKNWWNSVV